MSFLLFQRSGFVHVDGSERPSRPFERSEETRKRNIEKLTREREYLWKILEEYVWGEKEVSFLLLRYLMQDYESAESCLIMETYEELEYPELMIVTDTEDAVQALEHIEDIIRRYKHRKGSDPEFLEILIQFRNEFVKMLR